MIRRANASLFVLTLSLLFRAPAGWAFEVRTHRDITRAAFARSKVSVALRSLGIDPDRPLKGDPFVRARSSVDWLAEGSIDEDDFFSTNFARFRNHFFDPVNNQGLTAVGGERAPDWALEDQQEFTSQAFSYRDARQAFLDALIAPAPGDREQRLARTFETLGHVIHVIQDMASPPHTRDDIHGGFLFGPESLYEKYLDQDRVRTDLDFNGTPVRLGLPREYWITGDGRGLAEFVNKNFVSQQTNFTASVSGNTGVGYLNPVLQTGTGFEVTLDIQTQLEPGLRNTNGDLVQGTVTFFANNFVDPITGQALRNERMTTFSIFDGDLELLGAEVFALNKFNVEAYAAFLIPRAVGYSSALIDYFFRGRLGVDIVASAGNPSQLELKVTNLSPPQGVIGPGGKLTVHCDDVNGNRTRLPDELILNPGETVAPGADFPRRVLFSPPPVRESCIVVFTGPLGNEADAVIGKVFDFGNVHNVDVGLFDESFNRRRDITSSVDRFLGTDIAGFFIPRRANKKFIFLELENVSSTFFSFGSFGLRGGNRFFLIPRATGGPAIEIQNVSQFSKQLFNFSGVPLFGTFPTNIHMTENRLYFVGPSTVVGDPTA